MRTGADTIELRNFEIAQFYGILNLNTTTTNESGQLYPTMADVLRQFKASIFQALAHQTRIAVIEILREGEQPVSTIIERLGVEPANASQHLSILRSKYIVTSRKEGSQVFYSIRDPLIIEVLDIMRRYFQAHVQESMALIDGMDSDAPSRIARIHLESR